MEAQNHQNELYHYGVPGMRWGVIRSKRRLGYRTASNRKTKKRIQGIEDRTNTKIKKLKIDEKNKTRIEQARAKAQSRIDKVQSKYDAKKPSTKPKSLSEMSDDEIRSKINRIKLENELKSLQPQQISKGKAFINSVINDVITPAAKSAGKAWVEQTMKEALGVKNKKDEKKSDEISEMKKFVDDYNTRKNYNNVKKEIQKAKEDQQKAEKAAKKAEKEAKAAKKAAREAERESKKEQKAAEKEPNQNQSKSYTGTVEGKGTSARNDAKSKNTSKDNVIEGVWREVPVDNPRISNLASKGQQFLLEEKRRK